MPSLYSKYCKEVLGLEIIEESDSFITFLYLKTDKGSFIKIHDLYVNEEIRGNKKWFQLMEQVKDIAKQRNCTALSAQISKTSPEVVQNRTEHLCKIYEMQKTYEDFRVKIYSRGI